MDLTSVKTEIDVLAYEESITVELGTLNAIPEEHARLRRKTQEGEEFVGKCDVNTVWFDV